MYNKKMNNRGSATIFMILLLIPIVAFLCMVIRFAQLAATKGMAADAAGLATNAMYASYNQPMMEAYGIICYTKTSGEMTEIANYHMNNSMDINASGQVVVTYQGDMMDNSEFAQQIEVYMSNWDKVASGVDTYQLLQLKTRRDKAIEIKEKLNGDYERAVNSSYAGGEEIQEASSDEGAGNVSASQVEEARKDAIKNTNANNFNLDFQGTNNEDKPNYSNTVSLVESSAPIISYENEATENVEHGMEILGDAINYMEPIDRAYYSKLYRDINYQVALYGYNNFSAFNYYGKGALTGNLYGSGDVISISPWAETEFLLNGTDSDEQNARAVKNMIYDVLFMEYVAVLYDTCMSNPDIQAYAEVLSEGNPDMVELIKDEFAIGIAAQLAYETLTNTYSFGVNDYVVLDNYAHYMEVFLLLEANRDLDGQLNRMKYIITANMQNPVSSDEANEFSFDNARLMPVVDSYHVTVTPSFGGSISFEGR